MSDYTSDSIKTLQKLDSIRHRPTAHLPDLGRQGLAKMISEVIDNSFDEVSLLKEKGKVDILLFRSKSTFQVLIHDNGRGIPVEKLVEVFTVPSTSGKYDTESYTYSSGLFGLGAKVAAGLSDKFRALTFRGTKQASLFIQKGQHPDQVPIEKGIGYSGTLVFLEPDQDIFTDIVISVDDIWVLLLEKIRKILLF